MTNRTKETIENLYELNRIDNRLIGCLEERIKNLESLYLKEMLAHSRTLDRFVEPQINKDMQDTIDRQNEVIACNLLDITDKDITIGSKTREIRELRDEVFRLTELRKVECYA